MSNSKAQKKLKNFKKEKEKIAARFKSLCSFLDHSSPEEQKAFYNESYEQIFSVFLARFAECEAMPKKEGKTHMQNIAALLRVLKLFLVYLPSLIKKRWQFAKIANVIQMGIDKGNRHAIRLLSLDLLLLFIEVLQTSIDEQIVWFAKVVNLDPFTKPSTARPGPPTTSLVTPGVKDPMKKPKQKKEKTQKPEKKDLASIDVTLLCPSRVEPTRDDAIELLHYFFDFISKPERKDKFEFWFELWKENYYTVFYPQVSLDMALISSINDHRFSSQCPLEVQHCLIERLIRWYEEPFISAILWLPKNGPLMMEISRQACFLPLNYATTIKQAMQIFRSFLMSRQGRKINLAETDTQNYWKQFMNNLALIFTIKSKEVDEIEKHAELCKEVLSIECYFSMEMATKMEQETWKCLQMTMLDTTYSLLNNSSPFNAPSIASTMADSMFQALFLVWIRSEITSQEMWLDFSRKVSSLVAWKATVDEWKEKTIQLTYILIDHFYDHGAKEKDAKEKDSKETEKEGHEGEDHPPQPLKPDVGEAALSVPSPRSNPKSPSKQLRDAKLNSIPWTPDKINSMWYTILNILGNLCDIQDPNNFSIAMLCISDVIDLLLAEEAQLVVTATPPIPIGVIFLPWILQACTVDEKRNRGRLTALATLCRIFCRRHAKPPHIDLLSHFYRVLQMSLQSNQTSMVWVIIRHASHLFSLDLPGVSVLIPDFLREIEKIWKPAQKNAVPEDVHQKSLLLAISLVCFPVHFPGLDFPTMNVSQMDALIGSILLAAIKCKDISLQDKSLCLWGLTLRTIVNLQNGPLPSKKEEIGEMVRSMVVCANHRDETVARTALDCLSTLAQPQLLLTLAQVDLNIVYYVVDNLSDNIIGLISSGKSNVQEAMNGTAIYRFN